MTIPHVTKIPIPGSPSQKGLQGGLGKVAPTCPRFGTVARDPEHLPAGMAVVAGGWQPLTLPPQGTSPGKEPSWMGAVELCTQGCSIPFSSPLVFILFCFFFYSLQLVKTRTSKIDELSNYVR